MASFVPSNSCHLQQLNSIYWCTYASRVSPLPLKGTSLALEVIYDWPLSSGLLHLDCTISPFCLCSASLQEVPFSAFCQWRIPTICLPVWGLPHQSESHLNPSHSPPMCQYSYRAPCISQLQDRCCHYGSRSWSATLGYPSSSSSFFIIITIFIIYTKNVRLFALQIARKLVMAGQARYMNNFNKTSYLINL